LRFRQVNKTTLSFLTFCRDIDFSGNCTYLQTITLQKWLQVEKFEIVKEKIVFFECVWLETKAVLYYVISIHEKYCCNKKKTSSKSFFFVRCFLCFFSHKSKNQNVSFFPPTYIRSVSIRGKPITMFLLEKHNCIFLQWCYLFIFCYISDETFGS
jgi:hypothetical protein